MFGRKQIEIGADAMPQDFIRVKREDLRLNLEWGTLLTRGYALMGQEEIAAATAHSLSARLIKNGFEVKYSTAFLAGNPRSRQVINGYRAVFAKPVDQKQVDANLFARFNQARKEQV